MNIIKQKNYYIDKKTKRKIKSKKIIKQIKSMKIPPKYKNVKINTNKNAKIMAIGTDNKGRNQYIYNKNFIENQKIKKFNNQIILGKYINRIKKDIKENINSNKPIYDKDKIISIVLFLIFNCNFRVGNHEYKIKNNTYGTTTLNKNHLIFKKNEVEIKFIGKKNVENKSIIKNKKMIHILKELCYYNRNEEYIFYYLEKDKLYPIHSTHINNYLKKFDDRLTVKMIRTWNANKILLQSLVKLDKPNSNKEIKKNLIKANKMVSLKLHNTPNVCKKNYIDNNFCKLYENNNKLFFEYVDLYYKQPDKFLYKLLQLNI